MPSFDHTIQVILALTPLLVAVLGMIVALAQMRVASDKKHAAAKKDGASTEPSPPQVATGVTSPSGDDDHADDAIGALTDARDLWKGRAEEYRDRLTTANSTLQQHGLPTA